MIFIPVLILAVSDAAVPKQSDSFERLFGANDGNQVVGESRFAACPNPLPIM